MNQNRRHFLNSAVLATTGMAMMQLWGDGGASGARHVEAIRIQDDPSSRTTQGLALPPGRQLFVDDFVVESATLRRTFHKAVLHENNPVLKPETALEMNFGYCPAACPFDDGVFYDPKDGLFKMWYLAGWFDGIAYATSEDGVHWTRPSLDVEVGTNRVLVRRDRFQRDGSSVWLDSNARDPSERFKMFVFSRERTKDFVYGKFYNPDDPIVWCGGEIYISPDGIHWSKPVSTGPCGDNTTFLYNAMRQDWFYSIRSENEQFGRYRTFRECPDFVKGAAWSKQDLAFWAAADDLDRPDPSLGYKPQLYKLSGVGYESLLLGMFGIFYGPPNAIAEKLHIPKTIDLQIGFSRDGINWYRPYREAFIASSRAKGTWNRGYLHVANGACLIVKDKLHFYFGAFSGLSPKFGEHMYAGGSTGLATLRRDGFASMDAGDSGGELVTRLLQFVGKYLFVNVDAAIGELRIEILDEAGAVIPSYSFERCVPITSDSTSRLVRWKGGFDLSSLFGKSVSICFHLTRGSFYSFWLSDDITGASGGYVGAGGPGFSGPIDGASPASRKKA